MLDVAQIQRPTLLLSEAICRANIGRMAAKAARSRTRLRPHAKTHNPPPSPPGVVMPA